MAGARRERELLSKELYRRAGLRLGVHQLFLTL
jgi:hypothetical protein